MSDIIELAGVLFVISASVTIPPAVWLLVWRRRRRDGRDLARGGQVAERLGRLEAEVDALTTEVARLTDEQRFLTNVLAKPPQAAMAPRVDPSRGPDARSGS
jgi:hypothetical protein